MFAIRHKNTGGWRTGQGKYIEWSDNMQHATLYRSRLIQKAWWFKEDTMELVTVKIVLG